MKKFVIPAVVVTLLVGVALFFFLPKKTPELLSNIPAIDAPAPQIPSEPAIRYPVAETPLPTPAPPSVQPEPAPAPAPPERPDMASADDVLRELLALLGENKALLELFQIDHFVQRVVVSIDNLTRKDLSRRQMPIKSASGLFLVQGATGEESISPYNTRRYAPYMELADLLDNEHLVSIYVRFYPLFQKAYTDLGNPSAYFNDRLIEVIDHLLETPVPTQPIRLERPGVLYRFADPDLESRSSGQKILLRIGSEHAGRIKIKLEELRKTLTTLSQRH